MCLLFFGCDVNSHRIEPGQGDRAGLLETSKSLGVETGRVVLAREGDDPGDGLLRDAEERRIAEEAVASSLERNPKDSISTHLLSYMVVRKKKVSVPLSPSSRTRQLSEPGSAAVLCG